jgi:hypothetical protein
MDNGQLPEWLRQKRAVLADVNAEKQAQTLARMTIKAEGETFWAQVCEELKLVSDNVPEGLRGQFMHERSATSRHEDFCQIQISYSCSSSRQSHTNLWYTPGDECIRYDAVPVGPKASLLLCVVDGKICATSNSETMDAEAVARFIAEPMIEYAMVAALAESRRIMVA